MQRNSPKFMTGKALAEIRQRYSSTRHGEGKKFAIADQSALKAVENAAPVRPLPAAYHEDEDIQFTFDYNAYCGGGLAVILPR